MSMNWSYLLINSTKLGIAGYYRRVLADLRCLITDIERQARIAGVYILRSVLRASCCESQIGCSWRQNGVDL